MEKSIISTYNLTKFKNKGMILDHINLVIEPGKFYGMLGKSGAGKTEIFRILMGIEHQTSGSFSIFGQTNEKELKKARRRIGCMIDKSIYQPQLTIRENLEYQRILRGIPNKNIVDNIIEDIGLTRVQNMKGKYLIKPDIQKLGLAKAMLGYPEFLILDGITVGVDTDSCKEIYTYLERIYKERNITIVVVDYNLNRMEHWATDFIMIHRGKVLEQSSNKELQKQFRKNLYLEVNHVEKAAVVLLKQLQTNRFHVISNQHICLNDYMERQEQVVKAMYDNGVTLRELYVTRETLDEYFLRKIANVS